MKSKTLSARIKPVFASAVALLAVVTFALQLASAQQKEIVWSTDEKQLSDALHGLRALPDDVRARTTKDLALKIRALPATENKWHLASGLAMLSTEGDFGHDTLQEVTDTLAQTLKERPLPASKEGPAPPYMTLASLVRYEHMQASVDDPQFAAAMRQLEADDRKREHPEFTLKDLAGKPWSFSDLRGKVVLLNFWATWCPPCRKEMPDLEALYERYNSKGLVVLGISDEEAAKIGPFIRDRKISFPILLDPGRKVSDKLVADGIPMSYVYDREGNLVAQAMDMRTQKQFLEMLGKAGLE
jgi:YD repeat-containing protein